MRGVTPSFFTPSLNLISVMGLWQYSNSTLNKLLLSALLIRPLIHVIFIATTTAIPVPTAMFTLLLMHISWVISDLKINTCWCNAGVMSAIRLPLSTDD